MEKVSEPFTTLFIWMNGGWRSIWIGKFEVISVWLNHIVGPGFNNKPSFIKFYEPKTILQKGNSLEISFDNTWEGLKTADGKPPTSFEIAGEDDVFFKAEAVLEKGTILLSSTKVRKPVSARYGWKPFSEGNLTNSAGLPASTFSLNVRRQ